VPDNWPANFVGLSTISSSREGAGSVNVAAQHRRLPNVDEIMIAPDHLRRIASWARELNEREAEIARAGIFEKSYHTNEFIFMRGDDFEYWPASSAVLPG
jgi:hypothetical protein